MSLSKQLVILLLLLIGGWAALRYYRLHNRLYRQLEELTAVLSIENDQAAQSANNMLKGIESSVAKGRNQPAGMALLHRAEALQASINQLIGTLRACGDQMHLTTSNELTSNTLKHPGTTIGPLLSPTQRQALQQQLAACADTLRQLGPAENTTLTLPALEESTPVVEALADLSQLESAVLAYQKRTLQHIAKQVEIPRFQLHLVAAATAESNVVAPGDTYRARLLLAGYYSVNAQMSCNGRPVPVSPDGIGQVRFRAPTRPGPATWTGTIRVKANDHDSTFRITVPYRVTRR